MSNLVVRVIDAHVSSKSYVFKGAIDLSPLKGLEEVVFGIRDLRKPDNWVGAVIQTICCPKQVRTITFNVEYLYFSTEAIKRDEDKLSANWSKLDQIFQECAGEELEIVFNVFGLDVSDPAVDLDKFLGCCRKDNKVTINFKHVQVDDNRFDDCDDNRFDKNVPDPFADDVDDNSYKLISPFISCNF
jgi:hypothetical protein